MLVGFAPDMKASIVPELIIAIKPGPEFSLSRRQNPG